MKLYDWLRRDAVGRVVLVRGALGVIVALGMLCLTVAPARADSLNWVGSGLDDKWSTGANWNTGNPVANGDALIYDDTVGIPVGAVNGVVDASYSVASMRFDNTTGDPNRLYTLQIAPAITLTSGALDVGRHDPWPDPGNANYVTATFTGGGKMVVNGPLTVRTGGSATPKTPAKLDVTALSEFTVNTTGNIHLGGTNNGRGELILSPVSLLRATNIFVPGAHSWATAGLTSGIYFGEHTTLNADNITVGGYGLDGKMLFQTGLSGPQVVIRDQAGTGRANLYIGDMHKADRDVGGTVDFTGGSVDAEFNQLHVGLIDIRDAVEDTTIAAAVGTLSISAGTIDATDVVLGRALDGGAGTYPNDWADGTLNISGGQFTAGTITLAQDEALLHDRVRGTVDLSGGTLSAGTIQKGAGGGETFFNWTGGTLHADTFGLDLVNTGTGTLAPGASIGTSDLLASYTQGEDATLEIQIDGTDFDFVHVTQGATLDGMLDVLFISPPPVGSTFDVLVADQGITDLGMDFSYPGPVYMYYSIVSLGGTSEAVRLHYTPEPATMTLLGLPLAWLARRRRNRK